MGLLAKCSFGCSGYPVSAFGDDLYLTRRFSAIRQAILHNLIGTMECLLLIGHTESDHNILRGTEGWRLEFTRLRVLQLWR